MDNAILEDKRGQGLLDMVFVIIIMVLLIGGIINIFLWANTQMVKRQVGFNQSRVSAGTSSDSYNLEWPLVYNREALMENKVILDAPAL